MLNNAKVILKNCYNIIIINSLILSEDLSIQSHRMTL